MSVYEQVKDALENVIYPEIKSIQAEIRRLSDKTDLLKDELTIEIKDNSNRIDSFRNEMATEIKRLDEKIDSMDKRLYEKVNTMDKRLNEKIDTAIQIRERLATLEVKVDAISNSK